MVNVSLLMRQILIERGPCHRLALFEACMLSVSPQSAVASFRSSYKKPENTPLADQILKGRFVILNTALWSMCKRGDMTMDADQIVTITSRGIQVRQPRTMCSRGHLLTPENTRIKNNGHGNLYRICRTCVAESNELSQKKCLDNHNLRGEVPIVVRKVSCKYNHELSEVNTVMKKQRDGTYQPVCRKCQLKSQLRYWRKTHPPKSTSKAENLKTEL